MTGGAAAPVLVDDIGTGRSSVRRLTLSRPEQCNAMDSAMLSSLVEELRRVDEAEDVRAVVLAGRGPCFSAGGDVKELREVADPRAAMAERARLMTEMLRNVRHLRTPVVVQQLACAEFVVRRGLPIDELFSHTWSLEDAAEAYRWFDAQADGKGVFEPQD